MKHYKTTISRFLTAGLIMAAAALGSAQTTNTIVAEFDTAPSAGSEFSIDLVNKGGVDTIAGFAFKLHYNPNQVSIVGITNNTGQSGAGMQYTIGAEAVEADGATASRVISGTTLRNLEGASDLVRIKLQKKPGFAPPLYFKVTDRATEPVIDGLQGSDLQNIPHTFDTTAVNQ
jgi:hypothetical protein